MSWLNRMLISSIGQKLIMSLTGLFLIAFLVVHCFVNSLIFFNDGGELFNKGSEFMGTNWIIRTIEIFLFVFLLLHIYKGYSLTVQNKKARPVQYEFVDAKANSKWYSRSMGILGTLLLMFIIIHLKHFWIISRFTDEITGGHETMYDEMLEVFSETWVVIVYVLAMISLAYHLLHGFQSAFQSLGINHKKYSPFIKGLGAAFSIIIPIIFAMMPLAIHFGFIK